MAELRTIDHATKTYADVREELAAVVRLLQGEIEAAKRRRMKRIVELVGRTTNARAKLQALIEESPEHFVKPKTLVVHGVRIGFQKGKGKIGFSDPASVVERIRKLMPDQADILIKTEEVPIKAALNNLTVDELKKLGVTVVAAGDQVLIKPAEDDVDKLVDALLKDEVEEARR